MIDTAEIQKRITRLGHALRFFETHLKTNEDRAMIVLMRSEVVELESASTRVFDSPIALLGESGAGKSTLINALIGMNLLPNDSGRAVTAAICEISGGHEGYRLTARIQSRADFSKRFAQVWHRLEGAVRDVKDAVSDEVNNKINEGIVEAAVRDVKDAVPHESARVELDPSDSRLLASVTGRSVEECALRIGGGLHGLFLPEVIKAFQEGTEHVRDYGSDDVDNLRADASLYLSASKPLWPMVNVVRVQGEFALLSDGVRIVDLPGLNDPNEARDKIAKDHLQGSKLIWLVLSAKRIATAAIVEYLTKSKLLTKLQLSERLASLAVVVTHADQLSQSGISAQFGLAPDAPFDEFLEKHLERSTQEIRFSLCQVWDETVRQADGQVTRATAASGREILKKIPVFSVDSYQSLLLRGIEKSKNPATFETQEQTGIPALERWIITDVAERERRAHRNDVHRKIERLETTIREEFGGRAQIKKALADLRDRQKGGFGDIKASAHTFLRSKIEAHALEKRAKAEAQAQVVIDAIGVGMSNADALLRTWVPDRLNGIHWSTLKAIVRRRGVFHGSTRRWDLPEELAEAITARVVFRWSELFNFAKGLSEELESKCGDLLTAHQDRLYQEIRFRLGDAANAFVAPPTSCGSLSFEFGLAQAALNQKLEAARRRFATSLIDSLREALQPAFKEAGDVAGRGTKERIVAILTTSLKNMVPELIPALSRDLHLQVHEVSHMLQSQVHEAHRKVEHLADRTAGNLEIDLTTTPVAELHKEIAVIEQGLSLLHAA